MLFFFIGKYVIVVAVLCKMDVNLYERCGGGYAGRNGRSFGACFVSDEMGNGRGGNFVSHISCKIYTFCCIMTGILKIFYEERRLTHGGSQESGFGVFGRT